MHEALQAGRDPAGSAAIRAYAWSSAGQVAARHGALDATQADFVAAQAVAPASFDGRMAAVREGELALRARRWSDAERVLARVELDPSIGAYAGARPWASSPGRPSRRVAIVTATKAVVAVAAGPYLALDLTWWSVADPMP